MPIIRRIKEPTLTRLVSLVLLFLGIMIFSSGSKILGLIVLISGLGLLLANSVVSGIDINTEQKYYRKIYSFFGLVFGEWESLPKTDYLSVYKTRATSNTPSAPYLPLKTDFYAVSSFQEDRRPVLLYKVSSKKDAFETATHIAAALGVKILDATETEQKWLEL